MLRVAIDTGGTFTDFVFQDLSTGEKTFWKTPSTPSRPEEAVLRGLAHLTESLGADPSQVREILLATTVVTNAIIERKGSPTGLITTDGFRDVLIIGRQKRHDAYDLYLDKPRPLVPRRNIMEVNERLGHDGEIIRQLDMDSVERAIGALLEKGVESIAVCLLHSYANPVHERAIGEHLRALAPGVSVSLSSDVSPKYREYERTSTTVANAYVKPILERYLDGLESVFAEKGFTGDLFAMQSNGGLMTPDLARKFPVTIVESGPSAGVLMCSIVGREEGFENVLTFDMGGTTAKVGAMEGGEPTITPMIEVDGVNMRKWSGLPLNILALELIEIGAGGGSIASVDMGLIRVGPQSAGADPGPVCYGRGGREVTLTDANLVLGYINPDNFAGGSIALDLPAAEAAIRRQIAEPLNISTSEAAWGIHAVANASMERAMRSMSMERGRDPRNYTMVAFGGAGPLHASRLARALGVPRVIIPWGAGVGSAVGLLDADPKFSATRTHLLRISEDGSGDIAAIYGELERSIRADVRLIERAARVDWRRFAYLRYVGQGFELKIDLPPGEFTTGGVSTSGVSTSGVSTSGVSTSYAQNIIARFHKAYEVTYGFSQEDRAIEATDWYLTATIPTEFSSELSSGAARQSPTEDSPADTAAEEAGPETKRNAYFHELGGYVECRAVNRYALKPGDRIEGPAIVEEREATTVILPGDVARVSPAAHLILTSQVQTTEDAS